MWGGSLGGVGRPSACTLVSTDVTHSCIEYWERAGLALGVAVREAERCVDVFGSL